jgi:hypothetical protein
VHVARLARLLPALALLVRDSNTDLEVRRWPRIKADGAPGDTLVGSLGAALASGTVLKLLDLRCRAGFIFSMPLALLSPLMTNW